MYLIGETAYPVLKNKYTKGEIEKYFTPGKVEIEFARSSTRSNISMLNLIIMLKCFQCLGYFPRFEVIPFEIILYISECLGLTFIKSQKDYLQNYRSRDRHMALIRKFLRIKPYNLTSQFHLESILYKHAQTKDETSDLINIAIEELIKEYIELPAYSTLVRLCDSIKVNVYDYFYDSVKEKMEDYEEEFIYKLLEVKENITIWNTIKQEPQNPTLNNLKELMNKLDVIGDQKRYLEILDHIPDVKLKRFAAEAMTLDAYGMKRLKPNKLFTFAYSFLTYQYSKTLDDLTEMLIKIIMKIHSSARNKLDEYKLQRTKTTDSLIEKLKDVIIAYQVEGRVEDKYKAIGGILENNDELLKQCNIHLEYAGNNYLPFLWDFFKGKRSTLFKLLDILEIQSTTLNNPIVESIHFLKKNSNLRKDWIEISIEDKSNLDFSWIDSIWWKLITGYPKQNRFPNRVNRRNFEVCIFTEIVWQLKSGDLFIANSDEYSDYREQLVSWDDYEQLKDKYSEEVELPNNENEFVDYLQNWLRERIKETDNNFKKNEFLRIENGEPILSKVKKVSQPSNVKNIESLIKEKMQPVNILDILTDSDHWLKWSNNFSSISGYDTRLDNLEERIISTTFCYGCNLGPTQTSRALESISRKQIQRVDKRYVSIDKIDNANTDIINAYSTFLLSKFWGSGKSLAADGTKWDLYVKNLLSEYHIRYGGYGGIGYYHISDNYIAFFSHFIPCGVWEAVYILDAFISNKSDLKPDTVFSDTQGQNAPVFGLSFLLGIDLMPRIRNWKDYKFYKVNSDDKCIHIDSLFSGSINWELIRKHYHDMMRVVVSIKEGKIKSSSILKKLSTYNRKNNLYKAFRELGRVIRTGFLMKYINDPELRSTIQSSTNKVEAFNGFAKWISFGEKGIIKTNNREMQKKLIKYNQLVANCIIFHNANSLTEILANLIEEGHNITKDDIKYLSPYITSHINRFGKYKINMNKETPDVNYGKLEAILKQ